MKLLRCKTELAMKLSHDTVLKTFNRLYELSLNGLPQSSSVFEVAEKLEEKRENQTHYAFRLI